MSPTSVLIKAYGNWTKVGHWAYEHSAFLGWIIPQQIQRATDELGCLIMKEAIEVEVADCRHPCFLESYGCRNTGCAEDRPDLDILISIDTSLFDPEALSQRFAELAEEARAALQSSTNGNDLFPKMRFQICQLSEPITTSGYNPRERVGTDA